MSRRESLHEAAVALDDELHNVQYIKRLSIGERLMDPELEYKLANQDDIDEDSSFDVTGDEYLGRSDVVTSRVQLGDVVTKNKMLWVPANYHPSVNTEKYINYIQQLGDGDENVDKRRVRRKSSVLRFEAETLSQLQQDESQSNVPETSLRELSHKLSALSLKAGLDSDDAVTLARTLSMGTDDEEGYASSADLGGSLKRSRFNTYSRRKHGSVRRAAEPGSEPKLQAENQPRKDFHESKYEHAGSTASPGLGSSRGTPGTPPGHSTTSQLHEAIHQHENKSLPAKPMILVEIPRAGSGDENLAGAEPKAQAEMPLQPADEKRPGIADYKRNRLSGSTAKLRRKSGLQQVTDAHTLELEAEDDEEKDEGPPQPEDTFKAGSDLISSQTDSLDKILGLSATPSDESSRSTSTGSMAPTVSTEKQRKSSWNWLKKEDEKKKPDDKKRVFSLFKKKSPPPSPTEASTPASQSAVPLESKPLPKSPKREEKKSPKKLSLSPKKLGLAPKLQPLQPGGGKSQPGTGKPGGRAQPGTGNPGGKAQPPARKARPGIQARPQLNQTPQKNVGPISTQPKEPHSAHAEPVSSQPNPQPAQATHPADHAAHSPESSKSSEAPLETKLRASPDRPMAPPSAKPKLTFADVVQPSKPNQPMKFTDSSFGFPLPPLMFSTVIMLDYRLPIHVERAIYRLSHLKLANPKRELRHQVLLSNFMYAYLNLVNHTLEQESQEDGAQ